MARINRIVVPFGSLRIWIKDPSWDPFGSHVGLQNASFWTRFLNVISDTFLIRFWLHFCLVLASCLYHFRLVWRVRLHPQKLHPYGTKTSFLFQPVSNSLQNAHYVEDRLGAPAGFKKMPIWAPFWHPNGSQNGHLKASETTIAPRDPQRPSEAFKSSQHKPVRARTWSARSFASGCAWLHIQHVSCTNCSGTNLCVLIFASILVPFPY